MPMSAPPGRRARSTALVGLVVAVTASVLLAGPQATAQAPEEVGRFGLPFAEPVIYPGGDLDAEPVTTDEFCIDNAETGIPDCKPAAVTMSLMPDGRLLYFNGLENTEFFALENAPAAVNAVGQAGQYTVNDQTRVLDLRGSAPTWTIPTNPRAETDEDTEATPLFGPLDPVLSDGNDDAFVYNDQALFCADVQNLADGTVLAIGGTNYYTEPRVPGTEYGVVELEGTTQARIFDPATDTWRATEDMAYGRWYPTAVTLADGDQFVASGVTKLIKPVYPEQQGDAGSSLADSGRNVVQSERYDLQTGTWTTNPPSADRSLPLFPRLHLLPDGQVLYNAAGQVYNPQGQAYDEALWNIAAAYDPVAQTWTDLGVPGLTAGEPSTTPGFRGSSFSVMLPLRPDEEGRYTRTELLSAGGTVLPTPGSYVAVDTSYITTVDTAGDGSVALGGRTTGPLAQPRWYGSGVALPDGSVLAFSGANRDEVVGPGSGNAITVPELFDPETETWTPIVEQSEQRTYHNMAMLLPDGRVAVAGHSPIPDAYGLNGTFPEALGFSAKGRNPTFEIYEPPYLFQGARPEIGGAPDTIHHGQRFMITASLADERTEVVLVRNPSVTHLLDADQRTVVLPTEHLGGTALRVTAPPDANVAPPGDYMLFVNRVDEDGDVIPSVSVPVHIPAPTS